MRNLATVQVVKELTPIPGKDNIVLASFEGVGFKVICNKSETEVGSVGVYFEVDSLLPPTPEFEFLRKRCWSESFQGHRIRAMKMGGIFSEGLFLPLSAVNLVNAKAGQDVSDLLKVTKYDPEGREEDTRVKKKIKSNRILDFLMKIVIFRVCYMFFLGFTTKRETWPKFISKTDETRAQKIGNLFELLKGKPVYVTEKCEGQSVTYALFKNRFYVCSKNFILHEKNNPYWEVAIRYGVEDILRGACKKYRFDVGIQCKNCGPGIQGNIYKLDKTTPFVFNLVNLETGERLHLDCLQEFCAKSGLNMVPLLSVGEFCWDNIDDLTSFANGKSVINPKADREGVVIRTLDQKSGLHSFKVISPNYMLKKEQ
jgi:hypothetical protein